MVTVDEGKVMLDRDGYKMLDIRPFKAYDRGGRHGAVSAARSGSYATAAKAVEPWRGGREE